MNFFSPIYKIRSIASRGEMVIERIRRDEISSIEVAHARDAWVRAVESRDIPKIVSLYHNKEGRLLGTLDTARTDRRLSHQRIRDYFEHFCANDKLVAGFTKTVEQVDIQQLGNGYAAYSGYYTFKLTKNKTTKVTHAKFTYIYKREADGNLYIVAHNSGLTPEGIE